MRAAVRSELLKYFTTRVWWGMALALFVAGAAFALLFGILFTSETLAEQAGGPGGLPSGDPLQVANSVYTAGLTVGYLLMLCVGVLQIGTEYRHKTLSATFLATPRRARAMLAKVVALLAIAAGYGVVSLVGSVSVGALVLNLRGAEAFPSTAILRTLTLSLLVLGLWALIGLGLGILIPNQVAALMIGVGVAWIVEPLVGLAIKASDFGREHVAPLMPTEATNAVVNAVQSSPDDVRLSWWVAALVLAGWAALLTVPGIWRTVHQDVT